MPKKGKVVFKLRIPIVEFFLPLLSSNIPRTLFIVSDNKPVQAGCSRLIKNFSEDIKDSEIYTELLAQVAPRGQNIDRHALTREDWLERADIMLSQAERIECKAFVTAQVGIL